MIVRLVPELPGHYWFLIENQIIVKGAMVIWITFDSLCFLEMTGGGAGLLLGKVPLIGRLW